MTDAASPSIIAADPVLAAKPENRVWKKFRRHKSALFGGVLVAFFILIAALAPLLPIPDPMATDWGAVRKAPSWDHWIGTDEIGRDSAKASQAWLAFLRVPRLFCATACRAEPGGLRISSQGPMQKSSRPCLRSFPIASMPRQSARERRATSGWLRALHRHAVGIVRMSEVGDGRAHGRAIVGRIWGVLGNAGVLEVGMPGICRAPPD